MNMPSFTAFDCTCLYSSFPNQNLGFYYYIIEACDMELPWLISEMSLTEINNLYFKNCSSCLSTSLKK